MLYGLSLVEKGKLLGGVLHIPSNQIKSDPDCNTISNVRLLHVRQYVTFI